MKRSIMLLLSWLLLHVVLLAILADHQDNLPALFDRYSLAYAAVLGFVVLSAIGGAIFWWRPPPNPPRWLDRLRAFRLFMPLVVAGGLALLLGIWTTPFTIFVNSLQKEILRSMGTVAILAITYAVLFWCHDDQRIGWRTWLSVGLAATCGAIIVTVHYLDRFPQLNQIDELHNWVVQWTYANTGLLGDSLYRQMIPLPQPIYDSPHYIFGFLLRFIGDSFWQARFAHLLMASVALPFIYLLGCRMYGRRTGLFAVVLAVFLLAPTAYVRPDVFVGVMLSVALYVYWRAQTTRRPWMHYLTGLCVALAGEGHPLAYRFGLSFALIYGVRWCYEMWKARRISIDGRVIALALGGLTGMLIYLSIHILPGLEQGLHFAKNYTPNANTGSRAALALDIILRQMEIWIGTSPIELLIVVLGVVLAFNEMDHPDRLLLVLLGVSELLMLATYGYYREFYQVHFLPVFALLGGRLLANITGWWDSRRRAGRQSALILASMVLVVLLTSLTQSATSAVSDPQRDEFEGIGRQLKADLPPNAIVVGNENYFLEIRSLNYYGIQTITTDSWFLVNYEGVKLWEVTKPDIFILTSEMDTPKYTDSYSISQYMEDNKFQLVRCYTQTGLINARVYVRELPPGWTVDFECRNYAQPPTK